MDCGNFAITQAASAPVYQKGVAINLHKHYTGAAHSFEIVNTKEDRPDVTILKTFFINDTVNINDWQATWEGLKEDAKDLPGTPLVLQEDLEHPKFSVQEYYDRGTIFDYDIDEEKHQIIVYIRITDPTIIERIKSGELQYVSPSVIPRGSEYISTIGGIDIMTRTLPLHLAIVGNPAYGTMDAKMSHLCSGDGVECYHRLKIMKAAADIYIAADECVSKKIKVIMHEKPNISQEQAAAIAYSMCDKGKANVDALTQTPLIQKMMASIHYMASTLDKNIHGNLFHKHNETEGIWINTRGIDVFIANGQTIGNAISEQCPCSMNKN